MNEDEFRGRDCKNAPEDSILHEWEEFDPDNYAIGEALRTEVILGQRCKRCGVVKHRPFSLSKAMANGGKCLAGDRLARIVCTDMSNTAWPLLVLVADEAGSEMIQRHTSAGYWEGMPQSSLNLRNLPEYQEAEVLLWYDPSLEHPHCWEVTDTGATPAALTENAKPYGQPVKVKFPKG